MEAKLSHLFNTLQQLGFPLPGRFERAEVEQFLAPGEARLMLQEWLVETYENGILTDPDINSPNYSRYQRLQFAYDVLGVHYDNLKAIQGLSGFESALSVLTQLCDLAMAAAEDFNEDSVTAVRLINFISDNRSRVFDPVAKLFPPSFPPKFPGVQQDRINELQRTVEHWETSLEQLRDKAPDAAELAVDIYPTAVQLKDLDTALKAFSRALHDFRISYETSLQTELVARHFNPASSSTRDLGLGSLSLSGLSAHSDIEQTLRQLEEVWSGMQSCKTGDLELD
jgi:tetratricopeptide (TPR) repeat protein